MSQGREEGPLTVLAAPAIGLGILKLYLHFQSRWRFGLYDYLFATGAIIGGLFLILYAKRSSFIALTSAVFVAVEAYKGITDFRDHFDLLIAGISILYLAFPIFLYIRRRRSKR